MRNKHNKVLVLNMVALLIGAGGTEAARAGQMFEDQSGSDFMEEVTPARPATPQATKKSPVVDLSTVGVPTDESGNIVPLIDRSGGPVRQNFSQTEAYTEPAWNFLPQTLYGYGGYPYGGYPYGGYGRGYPYGGYPYGGYGGFGGPPSLNLTIGRNFGMSLTPNVYGNGYGNGYGNPFAAMNNPWTGNNAWASSSTLPGNSVWTSRPANSVWNGNNRWLGSGYPGNPGIFAPGLFANPYSTGLFNTGFLNSGILSTSGVVTSPNASGGLNYSQSGSYNSGLFGGLLGGSANFSSNTSTAGDGSSTTTSSGTYNTGFGLTPGGVIAPRKTEWQSTSTVKQMDLNELNKDTGDGRSPLQRFRDAHAHDDD